LHIHSSRRRSAALGLKVHLRCGLVLTKRDGSDADFHRQQIGALGEVVHHTLSNGFLVLDVFLAARKQKDAHGAGRDEGGANHISIIAVEAPWFETGALLPAPSYGRSLIRRAPEAAGYFHYFVFTASCHFCFKKRQVFFKKRQARAQFNYLWRSKPFRK
jgi:hypothetical protein